MIGIEDFQVTEHLFGQGLFDLIVPHNLLKGVPNKGNPGTIFFLSNLSSGQVPKKFENIFDKILTTGRNGFGSRTAMVAEPDKTAITTQEVISTCA